MKLEDFCHRVATRTLDLLERKYHYKIAEDTRKEVVEQIKQEIDSLMKDSS